MAEGKTPVDRFDGSDFGFWKIQIEDYLYGKDLDEPLKKKPEDMDEDKWKRLDRKAMSAVRLSLSKNVAYHTTGAKTTKEMMEKEREEMKKVPYASAVGSVMYAMVSTRPDIAHAVGVVSRYMGNPGKQHWEAVKWILRYLRGTTDVTLCFGGNNLVLQGFVDADLASNDLDKRRSTTGYVTTFGGTAISWASRLQKVVALSTAEAEYVAVTEASKEMVWLQSFLHELRMEECRSVLYSDSQSAIFLAKNPAFHSRTKHIQLKYHYIRHLLETNVLQLEKIDGSKNPADMFTKIVNMEKLKLCMTSTCIGT